MISYKTFLMIAENSDTYTKLVDIKDFPDLFAVPEKLEKTTIRWSSRQTTPRRTSINFVL